MGRIISSYIFPHPPIIVPEVGRGEEKGAFKTLSAVKKAAAIIGSEKPDTIIVTTPHGPIFQDYVYISTSDRLVGDLSRFGAGSVRLEFQNNISLVNNIIKHAKSEGIYSGGLEDSAARKYRVSKELDHGALIPLYFVDKEFKGFKLVHISIAGLSFIELYKFGMCISRAVDEFDEKIIFLASGDLSHRLSHDGPYGFSESGVEFDKLFVKSIKELNIERLLEIDESMCESAGECGLRSFLMMFGALDGYELKPEVYSYEGPFGVGYSVARFEVGLPDPDRNLFEKIEKKASKRTVEAGENEDAYINLAREALEAYVREKRILKASGTLPSEMLENRAGVFVTIKLNDRLRGCIGTIEPARKNIAEEIIYNAISAGTRDPRFPPIEKNELNKLSYSVDILKEPEPIKSINELDTAKYGVIVRKGMRSGLLLPDLEGIDTPEEQVSIALQKAGISPQEKYSIERFEVIRHK
jgi:AmmeMemoRadiSam system protein A